MSGDIGDRANSPLPALPRRRAWRRRMVLAILGCAGLFALVSTLFYATTLRAYSVPTGSMLPTIAPGDRVGVESDPNPRPARGEIWVFQMPPAAALPGAVGIKRIMGLPGENVEVVAGRLLIGGRPIDEPYLTLPFTYSMAPMTLGPNEYFALGDNRDKSFDSHKWGAVDRRFLMGRARGRFWPIRRLGGL